MKNFVTKTQTFYDHNMNPKIKQTDKSKKGFWSACDKSCHGRNNKKQLTVHYQPRRHF